MRAMTLLSCISLLVLTACPTPSDDGEDAGSSGSDAGVETDAGGDLLPHGALCEQASDCESNACFGLFMVGNMSCTATCVDDDDCVFDDGAEYACLTLQVGSYCARTCDTSSCLDEEICMVNMDLGTATMSLCLDARGLRCDSQADCAEGSCAWVGTGAALETFCNTSDDRGQLSMGDDCDPDLEIGKPCSSDADCEGGLTCDTDWSNSCQPPPSMTCESGMYCNPPGFCGGPCASDADCPTDWACTGINYRMDMNTGDPIDDADAVWQVCVPFAGSRGACSSDADCSGDEVCAQFSDSSGSMGNVCRLPEADDAALGTTCGDDPTTEDVEEPMVQCQHMCIYGQCTAACDTDADCGDAAQWDCREAGTAGNSFNFCLEGAACATDADCTTAGEVCHPIAALDGIEYQCRPASGDLLPGDSCENVRQLEGAPCNADSDCTAVGAEFFCGFNWTCQAPRAEKCSLACLSNKVCAQVCEADADCGDTAEWACAGANFTIDDATTGDPADDTTAPGRFCMWLPGSRTACTRDADCATEGELCRPSFAADGTPSMVCATAIPDGAAAGAPCGRSGTEAISCASDLCDYNDGDGETDVGTCGAACVEDGDCPSGLTCQPIPMTPNMSVEFNVCRTPGAGGIAG